MCMFVPVPAPCACFQILPTRRHTYRHTRNFLQFTGPSSKSVSCLVEGGSTLEVAVGLNWLSSRGPETPPTAELVVSWRELRWMVAMS